MMKAFRIQHERSYGLSPVLLLQNRVIEAETAEQALRKAMRGLGGESCIEVRHNDLALADRSNPATCFDFWKAEVEPYCANN